VRASEANPDAISDDRLIREPEPRNDLSLFRHSVSRCPKGILPQGHAGNGRVGGMAISLGENQGRVIMKSFR
jgi:hypothetical protein